MVEPPRPLPSIRRVLGTLRSPAALVTLSLAAALGVAMLISPAAWDAARSLAEGDRDAVRGWLEGLGPLAPLVSLGLNVIQAIVAPIPGFVVPYVNGMVFGIWWGTLVTWAGGVLAALACFWLARTIARPLAERFCRGHARVDRVSAALGRHGGPAVLLIRLLPGSPFDLVSYVAGLTAIRTWPFVWGTAIGSAPHALAYATLGAKLHVPLWLGLAMTPLVGLVYLAATASARAMVRLARARA